MRNGRLVLCILAVLSVVAAFFLGVAAPASAAPCPDKQVPAAAGGFCVSGGPPSPAPTASATAPAGPASPEPPQGGSGPAGTQPAVPGSAAENLPSQESVAGLGSASAPSASAGTPSAAGFATPARVSSPVPSRSARTLTAAPPDSGSAAAGTVPLAGYLMAIGGGMLLLSAAFGFLRIRPAAR
ncbi:hypothetical protein JOE40_003274 [Arthrobacter sp. PvP102]|uniref:hypothetical protein n=1 Tax=unclassified Arthrobacter TaxID=235627 RepID=UPI001AE214B2|nr:MULTISPECIES: hypothetical protein [unclassified Arthrobacter]MBP1233630.1 hypothetical protein [Arthrobacter sp. PvP103]MBP1238765.1 hypothetical protein [Arthrobacter sp. PvP102]